LSENQTFSNSSFPKLPPPLMPMHKKTPPPHQYHHNHGASGSNASVPKKMALPLTRHHHHKKNVLPNLFPPDLPPLCGYNSKAIFEKVRISSIFYSKSLNRKLYPLGVVILSLLFPLPNLA
jgi:hypothetical protein